MWDINFVYTTRSPKGQSNYILIIIACVHNYFLIALLKYNIDLYLISLTFFSEGVRLSVHMCVCWRGGGMRVNVLFEGVRA